MTPSAVETLEAPPAEGIASELCVGLSWRIIVDKPRSGSRNMALDHALARTLPEGEGVLRLYSWERPTVSFGRNEPSDGLYSVRKAERRGIDFVRRPTGGRAVIHDDELTYAVAMPARALGGPKAAYLQINEALVRGIGQLGLDVATATEGAVMAPDAGPCFRAPTLGEVVADGRKLVGSAQARVEGVLMQHGSLLLGGNQSVLDELTGSREASSAPTSLKQLVPDLRLPQVIEAVRDGFRRTLRGTWQHGAYRRVEIDEADRLEERLYTRDEWTWRR